MINIIIINISLRSCFLKWNIFDFFVLYFRLSGQWK